jgi:putative tryptophan/tyrosine transport system substrate-binding protein
VRQIGRTARREGEARNPVLDLRRRDFITLIAGAAAAWPRAVRAQQPAMPTVGYLFSGVQQGGSADLAAAFRKGLSEEGYVEGQNVAIEYVWAEGRYERLPALAANLVGRQVTVIAVGGGTGPILAVKAATSKIPIVFLTGTDPIVDGLVTSFNRPGGNLTGVYVLFNELVAKQLQVLHELLPAVDTIAILDNSPNPSSELRWREMQKAALTLGVKVQSLRASTERDVDAAFARLVEQRAGALIIAPDTFLTSRRDQILALAARHALPVMAAFREYPAAGGLMSYGPNLTDGYRQLGVFAGRVLKGAKPAELPVEQSTKVNFVMNMKTAQMLGLSFPITLLGRADEVIE